MKNSYLKATQTREQNQAAKAELHQEKVESIKLVRVALHRVLDNTEATPKEILRAAELLTELACPRR